MCLRTWCVYLCSLLAKDHSYYFTAFFSLLKKTYLIGFIFFIVCEYTCSVCATKKKKETEYVLEEIDSTIL